MDFAEFRGQFCRVEDPTQTFEAVLSQDWTSSRIVVKSRFHAPIDLQPMTLEGVVGHGLYPQSFKVWWNTWGKDEVVGSVSSVLFDDRIPRDETSVVSLYFYLTNVPTSAPHYVEMQYPIVISHGGYKYSFEKYRPDIFSHVITVENALWKDRELIEQTVQAWAWLLTFSLGYLCSVGKEVIYKDKSDPVLMQWNNVDVIKTSPYVIKARDVGDFVRNSLPAWNRHAAPYLMEELVNLSLLAKDTRYTNLKGLFMANWLELLRYAFAKNVCAGKYSYNSSKHQFEVRTPKGKAKTATFDEIMNDFVSSTGISGWDPSYTLIRNALVHEAGITVTDLPTWYREIHQFADRVILMLVDWDKHSGFYVPITDPVKMTDTEFGMNYLRFEP